MSFEDYSICVQLFFFNSNDFNFFKLLINYKLLSIWLFCNKIMVLVLVKETTFRQNEEDVWLNVGIAVSM